MHRLCCPALSWWFWEEITDGARCVKSQQQVEQHSTNCLGLRCNQGIMERTTNFTRSV